MAAQCLCRITMCFTQCLFSLPMHSMGKHTQPAVWGHETLPNTIPEMDSPKGSLFGKASFMQGYHLLISAKEKQHNYPH